MVKRWTQPAITIFKPEFRTEEVPLFEDAKGKYVLHTDYAALEARCRDMQTKIASWLHDGRLQTFEDRERIRAEMRACLAAETPSKSQQKRIDALTHEHRWEPITEGIATGGEGCECGIIRGSQAETKGEQS